MRNLRQLLRDSRFWQPKQMITTHNSLDFKLGGVKAGRTLPNQACLVLRLEIRFSTQWQAHLGNTSGPQCSEHLTHSENRAHLCPQTSLGPQTSPWPQFDSLSLIRWPITTITPVFPLGKRQRRLTSHRMYGNQNFDCSLHPVKGDRLTCM